MVDGKGKLPRAMDPHAVVQTLVSGTAPTPSLTSGVRVVTADPTAPTQAAVPRAAHDAVRRDAVTVMAGRADDARADSDSLARYDPLSELGRGGMGLVREAFDRLLGRHVAIKSLLSRDQDDAALLVAEAQVCAQLEHPSIVPLYDLDCDENGIPCYTMRVVRGRSLSEVLGERASGEAPFPLARLLGVFRQVCLAVDYAHSRGVVHRDLKPANVVLGEFGEVYVVDWGIARVLEGASVRPISASPRIAGTPGYMAPEQVEGDDLDGRADVFALGVMLYELLSGVRPFESDSLRSVVDRRAVMVRTPPSRVDPERQVPPAFDTLVLACLSPDPIGRPGRARAIASAIDEFLDGERARVEREREACEYAAAGDGARSEQEELEARAAAIDAEAERALAELHPWQDADDKLDAWRAKSRARALRADAARARARAETAYARALGRVAEHAQARRGLARLYFTQLVDAERNGDEESVVELLDLARAYDDGELSLELSNEGRLVVESQPRSAVVTIQRYEPAGPLLVLGAPRELGRTPTPAERLAAGSYLIVARASGQEVRYPIVVRRARQHLLRLRVPEPGELPPDMVLVPGGPFLASPRDAKLETLELPDFAIARFQVRIREYTRFLDDLTEAERARHMPAAIDAGQPYLVRGAGGWSLGPTVLEGPGRGRVPASTELDLPVANVRWYDALAYARWRARREGHPFRLPSDLEWEKAMRGADGRVFSMGMTLDPSFAKLRESRPEASQPEPVGSFPLDESPYGVRDLAGGVGDWTNTSPDGAPLPSLEEAGTPAADERQVIWRGGTWSSTAYAPRVARVTQPVRSWAGWIGFRLALSLSGQPSSELLTESMRE